MAEEASCPASPPVLAPDPRRALAAWYLRDTHRALWNIPMWFGVLFVLSLLILRGTFTDPRSKMRESLAAVEALQRPPIPKEKNAAEDYRLAFAAQVGFSGPKDKDPIARPPIGSRRFESADVKAFLESNRKAIELFYAGSAKERCDWGLDYTLGPGMMMPHLAKMRGGAKLLALHARERAHAGDHTEAAKAIAAIYRMAPHAETDPVIISGLVAIAMTAIADNAVESIVQFDAPATAEGLAGYRKALWLDQKPFERVARLMEGEKVLMLGFLDRIVANASQRGIVLRQDLTENGLALPWYGADRACLVGVMDEHIRRAREHCLPDPGMPVDDLDMIRRHQKGPAILTGLLVPVLSKVSTIFLRTQENSIVLDASLAFLQFRAKHGRDPGRLDDLVPEFLPDAPRGAFGAEPLRLRFDPNGVVVSAGSGRGAHRILDRTIRIYGTGENGQDDGGYNDSDDEELPKGDGRSRRDDHVVPLPPPGVRPADLPDEPDRGKP